MVDAKSRNPFVLIIPPFESFLGYLDVRLCRGRSWDKAEWMGKRVEKKSLGT